jgi:hypothetical protein
MGKRRSHEQNGDTSSCSPLLIKQTIDVWSLRKEVFSFDLYYAGLNTHRDETFEKCLILFKLKEDDNFNHRNTYSILRIKI